MMRMVRSVLSWLVRKNVGQALVGLGMGGIAMLLLILGGCAGGDNGGGPQPLGPRPSVTLTIVKAGTGTGTITSAPAGVDCGTTCTSTVTAGTVVTLTATPASGSTRGDWGGICSNTSATCAVTVTADQTVTVSFAASTETPRVSTTTSGTGSGTITCRTTNGPAGPCGTYSWGDQILITATPASGSSFAGWSGGLCTGTGTCGVTLTENIAVTATFSSGSTAIPHPARLSADLGSSLIVHADGRVLSLGSGMLAGIRTPLAGTDAKVMTGLSHVASVRTSTLLGPYYAITTDGSVLGWGMGVLGASVTGLFGAPADTPISVPAFGHVTALSVCQATGQPLTYALHGDGTVSYTPATSQIATNATRTLTTQNVPSLTSVVAMSEGCWDEPTTPSTFTVKSDGTVWSLTPTFTTAVGPSPFSTTTTTSVSVAQVLGLSSITQVSCGGSLGTGFCLARAADGTVWAWGNNSTGQLGDGTVVGRTIPIQIPGLASIATVIAGDGLSYAIDASGTVYSWGCSDSSGLGPTGQCNFFPLFGRSFTKDAWIPGVVTLPAPATALATSGVHTVVLLTNGTIWSWGGNTKGEFGNGTSGTVSNVPVQAVGLNVN